MPVTLVAVVLGALVVWAIHIVFVNFLLAPVGRAVAVRVVAALRETPALRAMLVRHLQVYVKHFRADRLGMAVMVARLGLMGMLEMLVVMGPALKT
jgi:hypothetical protein